jgi:hypothetical protein
MVSRKTAIGIGTVAFLWGALVSALLLSGCELAEGATQECAPGLVVQANVCPGTGGHLATCIARGEENGVSAPVGVLWCLAATTPVEGVTDYVECVPACP